MSKDVVLEITALDCVKTIPDGVQLGHEHEKDIVNPILQVSEIDPFKMLLLEKALDALEIKHKQEEIWYDAPHHEETIVYEYTLGITVSEYEKLIA